MSRPRRERPRRAPVPLDARALEELALAYVARFATSAGKLEGYLGRKLRERGWADAEGAPEGAVAAVCARLVDLGYIDDAGFARMRADSLLRRGYGDRRVAQTLEAAGIAAPLRNAVRADAATARGAALALARRRRLGPFGRDGGAAVRADGAARHKQIAALIRAGHGFADARAIVLAPSIAAAERWAGAGDDDEAAGAGDGVD